MNKSGDADGQRGGASDDGLLAQHKLLVAVIRTDWATRLDHKVAATIIERYMRKPRNARVSLRYLEVATGSRRNKIIASIRRLCLNGVFNVIRVGLGTRPTEYGLNFSFASSGTLEGTSSDSGLSGTPEGTSCGTLEGTASDSRGTLEGTESSLTVTGLQAELQEREIDCAAPMAPPGNGLDGRPGAVTAQGGFDELYNAYGFKRHRADARAAYEAISPDEDMHREMIAAAEEWHRAWAAQNNPDAPRKRLVTWLKDECYFEDPPTAFKAKEPKAERKPKSKPDLPAKEPAKGRGQFTDILTIDKSEKFGNPFAGEFGFILSMRSPDGVKKYRLQMFDENSEPGDDYDILDKLFNEFSEDHEDWYGGKLRFELDRETILGMTPNAKPPGVIRKTVTGKVIEAIIRDNRKGGQYLDLGIELPDGEMVGAEADLSGDMRGLAALTASAGLIEPQEESDFIGRTMTIVVNGYDEFIEALPAKVFEPATTSEQERPPFDEAGFKDRISRLEGPSFGGDDDD